MQKEEVSSQFDLHFTALFERVVSILRWCLHSVRRTGLQASEM